MSRTHRHSSSHVGGWRRDALQFSVMQAEPERRPGPNPNSPIGVFDSGVGGLTVARSIIDQLPNEEILYLSLIHI